MLHHSPLPTDLPGLTLRRLSPDDAGRLHLLVQANREHLTAHGDYSDQVAADRQELAGELAADPKHHWRFGIYLSENLIGRADLIGVEPPRYSLGYWLACTHLGRGLATEAVRALVGFAGNDLQASDVFAGVTHGNLRSIALLDRLGFVPAVQFETYTRYRLTFR